MIYAEPSPVAMLTPLIEKSFVESQLGEEKIGNGSENIDYFKAVSYYRIDPNPDFSESDYLDLYPDVASAVRAGEFISGFHHYIQHGASEGRSFTASKHTPARHALLQSRQDHRGVAAAISESYAEPELKQISDISGDGEKDDAPALEEPSVPRTPKARAGKIETFFSNASCTLMEGWIWEQSLESGPFEFLIETNKDPVTVQVEKLGFRGDVRRAGYGAGHCAFRIAIYLPDTAIKNISAVRDGIKLHTLKPPRTHIRPEAYETIRQTGTAVVIESLRLALGEGKMELIGEDAHSIPIDDLPQSATRSADWLEYPELRIAKSIGLTRIVRLLSSRAPHQKSYSHWRFKLAVAAGGQHLAGTYIEPADTGSLGSVDAFNPEKRTLRGWIAPKKGSKVDSAVQLSIDGNEYLEVRADRFRDDLVKKGITKGGGGFEFQLPNKSPSLQRSHAITLRSDRSGYPIKSKEERIVFSQAADIATVGALGDHAGVNTLINVVIPVYNALEEVKDCIESVLRWSSCNARLLIINDGSPDPRIRPMLESFNGKRNVTILHNEVNIGYTKTVNKAIQLCPDGDVILLNSDTVVSEFWLSRLRFAAYSSGDVGVVTPLSTNAGAYSAPDMGIDNRPPGTYSFQEFARAIQHAAIATYPIAPTAHGFCMYITRRAIAVNGLFDEAAFPIGYGEENDFSLRLQRSGLSNIIDDRTYIYHKRSASFGTEKGKNYSAGQETLHRLYPEYSILTSFFRDSTQLNGVRWRARNARSQIANSHTKVRPRILFVISTLTGGTPQTNLDLMLALQDRYEPWVMRCDSKSVFIYRLEDQKSVEVEQVPLDEVLNPSLHDSRSYQKAVLKLLLKYNIEVLHIRHLGWHGLSLPRVGKTLGIPVIYSLHDFYTVCPTVKLVDGEGKYCGGNCSGRTSGCKAELWPADSMPSLHDNFVHRWRDMFREAFKDCDAFVSTDESAKDIITAAYPEIAARFFIIPHGRDFEKMERGYDAPSPGQALKVLVPGNISPAKGLVLIQESTKADHDGTVDWHLLGDSPPSWAANVTAYGKYARNEFSDKVRAIRPHVGAVLSQWPETYCHTLTELWSCGLPIIGIDVGAVGNRIRQTGAGWLLPLGATPEDLLELAIHISEDHDDYLEKCRNVSLWQSGHGKYYDTHTMAAQYDRLYRSCARSLNPFHEGPLDPQTYLVWTSKSTRADNARANQASHPWSSYSNRHDRPNIFIPIGNAWLGKPMGRFGKPILIASPNGISVREWPSVLNWVEQEEIPLVLDARFGGGARLKMLQEPILKRILGLSRSIIDDGGSLDMSVDATLPNILSVDEISSFSAAEAHCLWNNLPRIENSKTSVVTYGILKCEQRSDDADQPSQDIFHVQLSLADFDEVTPKLLDILIPNRPRRVVVQVGEACQKEFSRLRKACVTLGALGIELVLACPDLSEGAVHPLARVQPELFLGTAPSNEDALKLPAPSAAAMYAIRRSIISILQQDPLSLFDQVIAQSARKD